MTSLLVEIVSAHLVCQQGICEPEFDEFGNSAHENFRISEP